jgi:hypothetical protein
VIHGIPPSGTVRIELTKKERKNSGLSNRNEKRSAKDKGKRFKEFL